MNEKVFIGIGSNIGNSYKNCVTAIREISANPRVSLRSISSFYATSPVSTIKQDDFVNCAVEIGWEGTPGELLILLNSIESSIGRKREEKGGPRVIDLDILIFKDAIIDGPSLTIPHRELHRRKFAIMPCVEIDPGIVHPALNKPLRDLLAGIDKDQRVTRLDGIPFTENEEHA